MKPDSIETVLNGVCEEVKSLKQLVELQKVELEKLGNQVRSFDGKLLEMKATPLHTDLSSIEEQVNVGIKRLHSALENYPKKITREFHFHFFPKINIKEYYQTYSKLVLYLSLLLLIAGLTTIAQKGIEGYNDRQYLIQTHAVESPQSSITPSEKIKMKMKKPIESRK